MTPEPETALDVVRRQQHQLFDARRKADADMHVDCVAWDMLRDLTKAVLRDAERVKEQPPPAALSREQLEAIVEIALSAGDPESRWTKDLAKFYNAFGFEP